MPTTLLEFAGTAIAPAHWSDSTLLVIDAQNEYLDGKLPLDGVEAALDEVATLLRIARQQLTPVIHIVQHSPVERGIYGVGTHAAEIIPGVMPVSGEEVIPKRLPNAFTDTPLAARLQAIAETHGRKKLILAGFMTHMCISATARSALDHGIAATVVAHATATRALTGPDRSIVAAATVQAATLAALADRFAAIVDVAADIPN